jgi:hypothetical protein
MAFSEWMENDFGKPENIQQIVDYAATGDLGSGPEARLKALEGDVNILVFAECWCPDVVRHLPIVERFARLSDRVRTRYLYIGDRPDLFGRYLTTGGEAVPKMVLFNWDWVECGVWGPMPAAGRELIARGRASGNLKQARKQVQSLYDSDPHRRKAIAELLECVEIAAAREP